MALTHALSTNNYGPAHLIVATSAANGTHTTLATAMADAVSGDTIFLRDSVTENVTLTAGVNIAAWTGGTLNTPTIIGTLTMTAAGTCNIDGIRLQTNSAALLAVTGSAASIVNITNCYINCSNNTGITFSTSNAAAKINIDNCKADIGTTGISLFAHSSTGALAIKNFACTNTGSSLTASTISSGSLIISQSGILFPITASSTANITFEYCNFDIAALNTLILTAGGNGTQLARYCRFASGSASAVTISQSLTMDLCEVNSSNTNAVTGAGTLVNGGISLTGTSQVINTTTQTAKNFDVGGVSFDGGANNLQNYATGTWTPGVAFGGGVTGITYSAQSGYYTRIGNVVFLQGSFTLSNNGSVTGNGTLTGLPFTAGSNSPFQLQCNVFGVLTAIATYTSFAAYTNGATTTANLYQSSPAAGGATAFLTDSMIANTCSMAFSGFYIIA